MAAVPTPQLPPKDMDGRYLTSEPGFHHSFSPVAVAHPPPPSMMGMMPPNHGQQMHKPTLPRLADSLPPVQPQHLPGDRTLSQSPQSQPHRLSQGHSDVEHSERSSGPTPPHQHALPQQHSGPPPSHQQTQLPTPPRVTSPAESNQAYSDYYAQQHHQHQLQMQRQHQQQLQQQSHQQPHPPLYHAMPAPSSASVTDASGHPAPPQFAMSMGMGMGMNMMPGSYAMAPHMLPNPAGSNGGFSTMLYGFGPPPHAPHPGYTAPGSGPHNDSSMPPDAIAAVMAQVQQQQAAMAQGSHSHHPQHGHPVVHPAVMVHSAGVAGPAVPTRARGMTRKHECSICGKAFARPSALRTHVYTHTGEKPFQCTEKGCSRSFSVLSNLRRHQRVHQQYH